MQNLHGQYLDIQCVCLPSAEHYTGSNRALQLAVLWHFQNQEVHKDDISAVARRDLEGAAVDQQVRHLKWDGWYIGPKAGLHQLDPYRVSQEFQNANARKRKRLPAVISIALSRLSAVGVPPVERRKGGRIAMLT